MVRAVDVTAISFRCVKIFASAPTHLHVHVLTLALVVNKRRAASHSHALPVLPLHAGPKGGGSSLRPTTRVHLTPPVTSIAAVPRSLPHALTQTSLCSRLSPF